VSGKSCGVLECPSDRQPVVSSSESSSERLNCRKSTEVELKECRKGRTTMYFSYNRRIRIEKFYVYGIFWGIVGAYNQTAGMNRTFSKRQRTEMRYLDKRQVLVRVLEIIVLVNLLDCGASRSR